MGDPRAEIHAAIRSLVRRYWGKGRDKQYLCAKEIADFWHETGNCGDKFDASDLSRKMNGSRRWAVDDVMALEAITGSGRITDTMREFSRDDEDEPATPISTLQHCKRLLREGNEGISALMAVEEGDGCQAEAKGELMDIVEAALAAIRDLDATK